MLPSQGDDRGSSPRRATKEIMKMKLKWRIFFIVMRIKKHIWCRFFHKKDRCYPDVSGKGLDGEWHCHKCVPCNIIWKILGD